MSRRILVAGVGNIFLSDDGFGAEVARRLAGDELPAGVRVTDFGIRGVHLAYELLEGYDTLILVDAAPRGGAPGTIYVIEPTPAAGAADGAAASADDAAPMMIDAHDMAPVTTLALLRTLGGQVGRVLIVGCEPETVEEGLGLSEPVMGAVEEGMRVVRELVEQEVAAAAP